MTDDDLLTRIRQEFRSHPGIALTLQQAQILWCLSRESCARAFDSLLDEGFLTQVDDVYLWSHSPLPRFRRRPGNRFVC